MLLPDGSVIVKKRPKWALPFNDVNVVVVVGAAAVMAVAVMVAVVMVVAAAFVEDAEIQDW